MAGISGQYYHAEDDPNNKSEQDWATYAPLIGAGAAQDLANKSSASMRERMFQNVADQPDLQFSDTGYQLAGQMHPEAYQDPTMMQANLAQVGPEGRAAQMEALNRMLSQSDQSVGSQQSLDRYNALQNASQFAAGREGAIEQDAARRGQAGSAAQMLLRGQAGQSAANNMQGAGLQSAQQAALQRLAGTQAYGQMGGQMRGQDQSEAFANQNALNSIGLANIQALNRIRAANTDVRNQAQASNLNATQSVMNANVGRGDTNALAAYNARMGKVGMGNEALSGMAQGAQAAPGLVNGQNQQAFNNIATVGKTAAKFFSGAEGE